MITQASLYCAGAALIAALYFKFILRFAVILKRKFHLPTTGLAMLPLIGFTIGLLYLEGVVIHSCLPALEGDIGGATLLGLGIGQLVSGPRGVFRTGFGPDGDDSDIGGGDSSDGGDGGGGH
jgi:hypothetical protein